MPRVPRFQERQRITASNPTGVSSSGSRIAGESLAQAGKGISNLGQSIADFQAKKGQSDKVLARSAMSRALKARLGSFMSKAKKNPDRFVIDAYDQEATLAEKEVLAELQEQHGDYSKEMQAVANDVISGYRNQAETLDVAADALRTKKKAAEAQKEYSSLSFNQPESVETFITDSTTTSLELMKSQDIPREKAIEVARESNKGLIRNAAQGFMIKGDFNSARDLFLGSRFSNLFTSDEQDAQIEKILQRETAWNAEMRARKRAADQAEDDALEEKQMAHLRRLTAKIEQAKLDKKYGELPSIKQEALDLLSKNLLPFNKFGGLRSAWSTADKFQDDNSGMELSKLLFRANSEPKLAEAEKRLGLMVSTARISDDHFNKWSKIIGSLRDKRKNDPNHTKNYNGYKEKLKVFTKSEDAIRDKITKKIGNQAQNRIRLQRYYGAHSFYTISVSQGMSPKKAFRATIEKYYNQTSLEPFPGYTKPIRDRKELNEFYAWARSNIAPGDVNRQKDFENYIEQADEFINRAEALEIHKEDLKVQDTAEESKVYNEQFKASEEIVEELMDFTNIAKPRDATKASVLDIEIEGSKPFYKRGRR